MSNINNNMLLKTIRITGRDVATFLQSFITCNVEEVRKLEMPLFAAACNQKGRIIANFWIWREDNVFYIQLPESMLDILLKHFKKYLFRSEVFFEQEIKIVKQSISMPTHYQANFTPIWILPKTTETIIPQMINMEKYGGVSFTKGCYLGQEVIARTEHLGKLKRHLYYFTLDTLDKTIIPNVGDDIHDKADQKRGTIVAVNHHQIFAVIEDRFAETVLYWKKFPLKKE